MKLLVLLIFVHKVLSRPDTDMLNMLDIIKNHGYPAEHHIVESEDGYITTIFRIPNGKDPRPISHQKTRPVVFVMHCLMCDSNIFIMNMPGQSLGFMLADAGFDVWFGNGRGTRYGLSHTTLTPFDRQFWDFSWYDIGMLDLPAQIDHALNVTGQSSLYHVGHSQGTATVYTLLSERPEYQDKIRTTFTMAPFGSLRHIEWLMRTLAHPVVGLGTIIVERVDIPIFIPDDIQGILGDACRLPIIKLACGATFDLLFGFEDQSQFNLTRLGTYAHHFPAMTSLYNIMHYAQLVDGKGTLSRFNHGRERNLDKYGEATAPVIDISKVRTRVHLFWSDHDVITSGADVRETLLGVLPNVVSHHQPGFTHMDYVLGLRAADAVYTPIIRLIYQDLEERWRDGGNASSFTLQD